MYIIFIFIEKNAYLGTLNIISWSLCYTRLRDGFNILCKNMPLRDNSYYLVNRFPYVNNNYYVTIIPKWHTAREHVIGKSEILNILSGERVFIAVENWMASCSRTSGLISPQNENL